MFASLFTSRASAFMVQVLVRDLKSRCKAQPKWEYLQSIKRALGVKVKIHETCKWKNGKMENGRKE